MGKRLLDETGGEDFGGLLRELLSEKFANYRRVGEILAALSRYGFGRAWDAASLLKDLPFDSAAREELKGSRESTRFRMLLEELGPTFIKLGQMLSTRPDLVPDDFALELGRLRDDAPPIPFERVRRRLEEELGPGAMKRFASFEEKPMAAASIGQVHAASLAGTGERVAVKVQRPGITASIRADIEILKRLAGLLERTFSSIERFNVPGMIGEFEHMILRELDYTIELRSIERFRANMAGVEGVVVPGVHPELSTRRVLTMEFIDGVSVDDLDALRRWKLDTRRLAEIAGRAYIKQIFIDGFFHADPHHGNLFALRDGRLCFLDFGAIGYLDAATRDRASQFYISLMRGDAAGAARALMELAGASPSTLDARKLEWDLRDFADYSLLKRDNVELDRGMNQRIVTIALKHGLTPPTSFVLLERALAELEGVCRALDPEFDIARLAEESLPELLRARYLPDTNLLRTAETAREYRRFLRELPSRASRIMEKAEKGELTVRVDPVVFDEIRRSLRRMALMVTASLFATVLVLYIGWVGPLTGLGALPAHIAAAIVFIAWLAVVAAIARRG
ncbi:MAG: ABC1 kinase family protein [Thermoplasmatota archaeon]